MDFSNNSFDQQDDGNYYGFAGGQANVFTNLPISPVPCAAAPKKPRNPLVAMAQDFGDQRIWCVQHWTQREVDRPASLWPSKVYNGLTYEQATNKVSEIKNAPDYDPQLNSVEICIKMGV